MQCTISLFGGIQPRLRDHMLGPLQATQAHDVKLRNGSLEPWMENCHYFDAVEGAKSFHLYGCCAVSWPDIVFCGDFPPDWKRFYIAGREGNGLEAVELKCECQPVYYTGGVPAPAEAPTVDADEDCSREAAARSYVYTYVNKWGEEGRPSEPSNIVRVDDCDTVVVGNLQDPPDGYGVVSINLYRATTGYRTADGKTQKPLTAYLFVATLDVPLESSTFTDDICAMYLGSALETENDRMPPMLHGVLSVQDQIRLVGWNKNRIYMSQQFEPHNWPAKYDLTLDHTIIHMKELDQKLYVTTDSRPYIVDVSSCDDTKCMPVTSVDVDLPDIGCRRANSVAITPHGLFYASPIGIILLTGNGSWSVATAKWFGEDEWRKIRPDTITMAYYEGYLFFSTVKATFLLDINSAVYDDASNSELVTLSDHPVCCEISDTGALVILQDDELLVWSGGTRPREYVWRSRKLTEGKDAAGGGAANIFHEQGGQPKSGPIQYGALWSPASVKVLGRGRVTLENPHGVAVLDRYVVSERPMRVARMGRHPFYWLTVRSRERVDAVDIGTSVFTVNTGA